MSGLFDSLAHMFGGAAVPGSATQKVALAGSPIIQALLAKHGAAPPEAVPAGAAVAEVADPSVGAEVGPEAQGGNVFDQLPTMSGGTPEIFGEHGMDPIKAALAANAAKPRGFMDRIGDFLHSDEGRGALLRSGAATLNGGLGAGIQAGADFVDHRRHERAVTAASDADRAERSREFDATDAFRTGQLDLTRDQNHETAEHYRRGDMNDSRRIDADLYKHDTPSGDASLQSTTTRYTHDRPSGDTVVNTGERRFEHLTPSGDVVTQQAGEDRRNTQDNQTSILNTLRDHPAPHDTIRLHYQATPQTLGAQHRAAVAAVRPSEVRPSGDSSAPAKVSTDAEFDALPSGTRFIGPDGQVRIKP